MSKRVINSFVFIFFLSLASVLSAQECNTSIPATTDHLIDNNDGTITDPKTSLMWKKCSESQVFNAINNSCEGSAETYSWSNALQQAVYVNSQTIGESLNYTDWRLPNIKELASILELRCFDPEINIIRFPNTPSRVFWSSSSNAGRSDTAWSINFKTGGDYNRTKDFYNYYVRLVRSSG